jgi:hypothetical protein
MFVPVHRRRSAAAGEKAKARPKPAAIAAAVTAVVAAMVSNLIHAGKPAGAGGAFVLIGLLIGIGAAALGLIIARAIGRQGRI